MNIKKLSCLDGLLEQRAPPFQYSVSFRLCIERGEIILRSRSCVQRACVGKTGTFTFCVVQVDDACSELLPTNQQSCKKRAQHLSKMRVQNQGLKTGSFAVTHARTLIVARTFLIFPRVRLHYVSSASKTCLDYAWPVHVKCFLFE